MRFGIPSCSGVEQQRRRQEQGQDAGTKEWLRLHRAVGGEELLARRRREEAPDQREVDGRVGATQVAPVDDAGQRAVRRDEQVPDVQIAVDDRRRLGRRQRARLIEQPGHGARRAPQAEPLGLLQLFDGSRDAECHVVTTHRIGGQGERGELRGHLAAVQGAEEPPERARQPRACSVGQPRLGGLTAREQRRAEEGPRIVLGGCADERRPRDRQGQQRCQPGQRGDLAFDARNGDGPPRKAERPCLVDQPHRVVPALRQQTQAPQLNGGELARNQLSRTVAVDDHLGAPLVHPREPRATRALTGARVRLEAHPLAVPKEGPMAKDHGSSVKNDKQYEGLRKKGMSKSRAVAIANSEGSSSRGGKKSGSGSASKSNSSQGGTTQQKKAAGRKGGKKSS